MRDKLCVLQGINHQLLVNEVEQESFILYHLISDFNSQLIDYQFFMNFKFLIFNF